MVQPIDIASGKPIVESSLVIGEVEFFDVTTDLLWFYQFDRLIIDHWGPPPSHSDFETTAAADEIAPMPIDSVYVSANGETFTLITPASVRISSKRGSLGSRRSYILGFDLPIAKGRYVRLRHQFAGSSFKPRILKDTASTRAAESSKMIEAYHFNEKTSQLPKVRTAVVGDSNSVMRYGWIRGLGQQNTRVDQNRSLGASQMTMLASRLEDVDGEVTDVLILNSVVNEYRPIQYEDYDLHLASDAIRHALSWCNTYDVIPVFIIWPHLHYLRDAKAGNTRTNPRHHYAHLCEDFRLPYVDAYPLLHTLANSWSRPLSSLFLDDAHLRPHVAQVLGAAIRWSVNSLVETVSIDPSAVGCTPPASIELDTISIPNASSVVENHKLPQREVTTSLIARTMVTLALGSILRVKVPEGWEVVAFMMNARNSNASLQIEGQRTQTIRADFSKYLGEDGFPFVCVRSLQRPVAPRNGIVYLAAISPKLEHQPDELAGSTLSIVAPGDTRHIEVAELIIRNTRARSVSRRMNLDTLNLTSSKSLDFATSLSCSDVPLSDEDWT